MAVGRYSIRSSEVPLSIARFDPRRYYATLAAGLKSPSRETSRAEDLLDPTRRNEPQPNSKEDQMPAFRTEVPHSLGKDEATEKLKLFLDKVRERYQDKVSAIEGTWDENKLDFSLTTFGFTISGNLSVQEELAVLEGQLPFAAFAFKGKIEQDIKTALEKALA